MKKFSIFIFLAIFTLSLAACGTVNQSTDEVAQTVNAQGREYDNLVTAEVGETTTNAFFEWTVSSVRTAYEIDGYTPAEGTKYVIADISTKNITYHNDLPLGNYDYIIAWGAGDEEWDWSLYEFTDGMYPDDVVVEVGKTVEGMLIFVVPEDVKDVSIIYEEIYDDDFVGNTYSYDIVLSDDDIVRPDNQTENAL